MGLFTTNAPAAKFAHVGDTVGGEIVDVYLAQRYEYVRRGTGQPLYWHNRKPTPGVRIDPATGKHNDPVMQEVITVDTGVPDDNGDTERRIFIKNKRMKQSLTKAVMDAGAKREGLLLGGRLACTFTGEEVGDGPEPAKVYAFTYTPPAPGVGREPDLSNPRLADRDTEPEPGSGAPTAPTAAPQAAARQPEPAPAAAPAPTPSYEDVFANLSPEQRAALLAQAQQQPKVPPF